MKLRFKIIQCSSQDNLFPVSNLMVQNGVWQSQKFPKYPQQLTIQFYQPINLQQIHIISHPYKISQRISIFLYLPSQSQQNIQDKFHKYGYVEFGNYQSNDLVIREMKKIQSININVLYMKLVIWNNHQNIYNFFNQVGLSQISIYGNPSFSPHQNILPLPITNRNLNKNIKQNIIQKLQIIQQFKQQFLKQNNQKNIQHIQQLLKIVKKYQNSIKLLQKYKAISKYNQQFKICKQIQLQINQIYHNFQYLLTNFYNPSTKQIQIIQKNTITSNKIITFINKFCDTSLTQSKLSQQHNQIPKLNKNQSTSALKSLQQSKIIQTIDNQPIQQTYSSMQISRISHDNRVIPSILRRSKLQQPNIITGLQSLDKSFFEDSASKQNKNIQNILIQQMTPSTQANCSMLFQYFQKQLIKKIYSKHWNFKLDALNFIFQDAKKWINQTKQLDHKRIKAYIFIVNKCIRQGNFQIYQLTLSLLKQLVECPKHYPKGTNKKKQLKPLLQQSINEIFIKMIQNKKFKQICYQIIIKMITSSIYGLIFVYRTIVKYFFYLPLNYNYKIKIYKIHALEFMFNLYGINKQNGLPLSFVDFICQVAQQSNHQLRKLATSILKKMKNKGVSNEVLQTAQGKYNLKKSIIKELQA